MPSKLRQYRHTHLKEVNSTNAYLINLAMDGDSGLHWVTAERQVSGKGSRGRQWTGIEGNLFASLLLKNPAEATHLHELTFVASLATYDAIVNAGASPEIVSVKWPNDVLVGGKKCCGILLESTSVAGNSFVVIGIGINCKACPTDTMTQATCLSKEGILVSPMELFAGLATAFDQWLDTWDMGRGFEEVRTRWLDRAHGISSKASVQIPGREKIEGRFLSIDAGGYMLLQRDNGNVERISTADIFFESPTGERV